MAPAIKKNKKLPMGSFFILWLSGKGKQALTSYGSRSDRR